MSYNESDFKYIYRFSGNPGKVNTPFVKDLSEIKNTILKQTPTEIVKLSEYPKGFKMLVKQKAKVIEIRTNYPLKEVGDNQFEIEFPE